MLSRLKTIIGFAALLVLLMSCASDDAGETVYPGSSKEQPGQESEPTASNDPFVRQRILADMLYEARIAFEDNRLMSPAGNNAFDGFRAVLDFEPDNKVALQGIRDIVLRYVELADAAIQIRQYDNAEMFLNRAARIGENTAAVADGRQRLVQARKIQMDIFELDAEQLDGRGLDIMVELGEIGQYIRNREATFLINARTDEEGRWIYKIMREAVGGHRLRGNIAVASEPSIQVVVPQS